MKMNIAEKHEWIEALVSGQYEQGEGVLYYKTKEQFCCLGVLAELSKERCNLKLEVDQAGYMAYDDDTNGLCKALRDRYKTNTFGFLVPTSLLTEDEAKGQNILHTGDIFGVAVSDLNDSGMKFTRIAELVDACVEAV